MAEAYSQDPATIYGTSGRGQTRRIWLWLLLLVLIVVLFTYDQGAMKGYGEKAYLKTESLVTKVTRRARDLYACGLAGCKSASTALASKTETPEVPATPADMASAVQTLPTAPTGADVVVSPQPSVVGEAAVAPAEAQQPDTAINAPSAPGPEASPAYPTYPAYPPYSAFGAGAAGSGASEPASSPPAPAQASVAAALPAPPPAKPSTPTTPEGAPGKPAYPEYPDYPSTESYGRPSPPVSVSPPPAQRSPAPLLPVPRVARPDQRVSQLPAPVPVPLSVADGLVSARQAASAGRYLDSIREYRLYLDKHPNDGDAYGELGNVFYKLKRYPEAAQNYYEVATRLIDAGHRDAVLNLMPIIEQHEPLLAALLQEKLSPRKRRYPY